MKKVLLLSIHFLVCHISFSQQKIKIACIGNSVTFGYNIKDKALNSYPAQLQNMLGDQYEVSNFGHSGATLLRKGHNPYYKTAAFRAALDYQPDIAIIHLGLNDTDPRNWPNYRDEFAPDYAWLIDTLRKVNKNLKVYICRLTPIFSGHPRFLSGTRDWFWQIQALIPQIAKANETGLIDLHTRLYTRPDLFPDNLHPNEEGAAIIAKTVYQKLSGDYGELRLASVFASHMVLQRNKPIQFYGTAMAGEKISVNFNKQVRQTTTGSDGEWKVTFPGSKAGGPYQVVIQSAKSKILLDDILIGEVWLCSGQSNMYFPLRSDAESRNEIPVAEKDSLIRFLRMKPFAETNNEAWDSITLQRINQLQYFSGDWQRCDSNKAADFSAVAFYFGKMLQQKLHVPIGLIQVAVGGSPVESWIDRFTTEHDNLLVNELTHWRTSDFLMPWVRERAAINLKNASNKLQRHPYQPCYNFDAGICRFTHFPIAGVIWYQGESNAHNTSLYKHIFPSLVASWRKQWGYDFPFYYVQLSSIDRPSWPSFRYMQFQLQYEVPNMRMAVSSDVGNCTNVHPVFKKPVGQRLARLALHYTYGFSDIVPSGPLAVSAIKKGDHILVSFKFGKGLHTADNLPVRGFSLVDEKGFSTDIRGLIKDDKIVLLLSSQSKIMEVRYGWEPCTDANLRNGADLPASTFRMAVIH